MLSALSDQTEFVFQLAHLASARPRFVCDRVTSHNIEGEKLSCNSNSIVSQS